MHPSLLRFGLAFLILAAGFRLSAHPVPDIPVRGKFSAGGEARIEIEIDPRCFAADPENEPYLLQGGLEGLTDGEKARLLEQAADYARRVAAFRFEPTGQFVPQFSFVFTGHAGTELKDAGDPVMLTGRWNTTLASGLTGYRIDVLREGSLSVVFLNEIDGRPLARVNVLFPGESSYLLDLTGLGADPASTPAKGATGRHGGLGETFVDFVRLGFVHVIPLGWDHILFVLGLFLLSREWRPLLWQVTMLTLAHTLTLGLSTLGGLSVPSAIVEPVIAASIAVIALENIFRPNFSRWRLVVVFVFGLVHGLGFAGALRDLALPAPSLAIGLFGFNVGVELGQVAIVSLAWLATVWLKREDVYRKVVTVPASLAIAGCGLWWTVERMVR